MGARALHFNRRMSDQDALMWSIEADPLLRSTITSVAILDRAPDREVLTDRIERASRSVPRLRQRVQATPYNLAPPEYVVAENFDLDYHLRWQRAPGDGTLRDVLDFAQPFAMSGFDHARPLWEMVVLEGCEGGRAAVVEKIHHSLADGVGMMKLSMAFVDPQRSAADPGPMPAAPAPEHSSVIDQLRAGLGYRARRQLSLMGTAPARLGSALRDPLGTAVGAARATASTARMLRPVSSPLSPIMTARSLRVRFDTVTASLPAMKAASKRVDGRLNDAFLAAVAGGLDRYHRIHGEPVDELRMTLPINVRRKDDDEAGGNQFVPMRFSFPVSTADPLERMAELRDLVTAQRAEPALHLAAPITGILNRLPVAATTALFGGMLKAIDVVTSNVPGAPFAIYIGGARLQADFGFGPLSGAACNITLLSYVDELHLAVSTDPAAVPDPATFVDCLREGITEVEKLAEA